MQWLRSKVVPHVTFISKLCFVITLLVLIGYIYRNQHCISAWRPEVVPGPDYIKNPNVFSPHQQRELSYTLRADLHIHFSTKRS